MSRSLRPFSASVLLIALAVPAACAAGKQKQVVVSLYSRADASYRRTKLPDGTFKPELYAISNGGMVEGTMRDNS